MLDYLQSKEYRGDVDGLRAVAVVAVVLFHVFPDFLPGGFTGVDVFFVISGFLISRILMRDITGPGFSIATFYKRRVVRIFPSFVATVGTTLVLGYFLLLPDELRSLGKHAFAGTVFSSNLVLWREAGYFDTASEAKPLLHLWSLGIEEQFYVVWPLVLVACHRFRVRFAHAAVMIALGSFAANVVLVSRGASSAAFYLPVTRAWELVAGMLCALWLDRREARPGEAHSGARAALALTGAGLIAASVGFIRPGAQFPGWQALLPVCGSAALILAGPRTWLNRVVLGSAPARFIGRISYPLYLWHWPLLSLAVVTGRGEVSLTMRIVLVATSVALAVGSTFWIEGAIRTRPTRGVVLGLLAAAGAVAVAGVSLYLSNGLPNRTAQHRAAGEELVSRIPRPARVAGCSDHWRSVADGFEYCEMTSGGEADSVLVGDSHAEHLWPGIVEADQGHEWLFVGHPSCPPIIGVDVIAGGESCRAKMTSVLEAIASTPHVGTVALSFLGTYTEATDFAADHVETGQGPADITVESSTFSATDRGELFALGLARTVDVLERAGKRVVIIVDVPELPFRPRNCLSRPMAGAPVACEVPRATIEGRQAALRHMTTTLGQGHPELRVFDSLPSLCGPVRCVAMRESRLLYRDSHHLSASGSRMVGQAFVTWLRNAE